MADTPMHLLRTIARRFAEIQRRTWACCTPATETQCLILTELHQAPGLSIRDLAARIGSDPPWVSGWWRVCACKDGWNGILPLKTGAMFRCD
ncbi:MarR family transcriptional regulator [Alicyclobacillus mengziensis]|uniref:MarR family transcriptional regulator n=1 Tax=Alicyclobacillus mengziensis TaxID=2931921 RepID=A0A9X7Z6R5_9BACL|nr:MarR family transcriptional regulator [Alicyclobacillus mengziensis]